MLLERLPLTARRFVATAGAGVAPLVRELRGATPKGRRKPTNGLRRERIGSVPNAGHKSHTD
jgi:hypothetical protein